MKQLKYFLVVLFMAFAMQSYAAGFDNGTVDGKYPIVFQEDYDYNTGKITGKYAYKSTLNKYGNVKSSYLYFTGYQDDEDPNYFYGVQYLTVKDNKGNVVEKWVLENRCAQGHLWQDGTITIMSGPNKGKTHTVYIDLGEME